jgi:putative two-component system response regulator
MSKFSTEVVNREELDIIRRMASIAEYRQPGIKNHLERIRGYCYVLSRELGLSIREAEIIATASMLHDLGEICIPDSVLGRDSKLTAYEWEMVKRHPTVGAELLKGSPSVILQAGEIIALTHHERWDGTGYPRGLVGEEIPVSGRICALADIFDALTTKRTYKDEIQVNEAFDLILKNSGVLFDPDLVTIFDENFEEILKIRQMNL